VEGLLGGFVELGEVVGEGFDARHLLVEGLDGVVEGALGGVAAESGAIIGLPGVFEHGDAG